jgi:hypothetical protein
MNANGDCDFPYIIRSATFAHNPDGSPQIGYDTESGLARARARNFDVNEAAPPSASSVVSSPP